MAKVTAISPAAEHYASAYETHHLQHNLLGAIRAFNHVIASHPYAPEAEYSRARMRDTASQPCTEARVSEPGDDQCRFLTEEWSGKA